eukprot:Plantae.Rhodophyta-Hildenbrandia_rubra.ctg9125.p1 GENE.Plantae.Rhodophyta-Hildenbrandia_rubra.ctg9125~~Plantae.Rhodophyta-Hildenbrandia_rubra.ctg9125.p1  ORF type:complete len:1076 (-),score=193.32 Plantae.Rhodophyta-Hildenbrandia_rubra.ctg9125:697-3924(-)
MILTAKYQLAVIRWVPERNHSITEVYAPDFSDAVLNRTDRTPLIFTDPSSEVIGVHQHRNLLKVILTNYKEKAFPLRLLEDVILDIVFLHKQGRPTFAVLSQDEHYSIHVKSYELLLRGKELVEGSLQKSNLDRSATKLIALPRPYGGVIVVGGQTISYFGEKDAFFNLPIDPTIFKAIGAVDKEGLKYLLGDHKGQLSLLVVEVANGRVLGMKEQKLGETSIASSISYLDNSYVFVGSEYGDSQLIKLHRTRSPDTGMFLEIIQHYEHLGPITDFCFVQGAGHAHQGQGQIVTCSGVHKDGSLRVVRNGIGITEQAAVEIPGIKEMFSLKRQYSDAHHTYLVQSFANETRVLAMVSADEMGEAHISGFDPNVPTLCAANLVGNIMMQITVDGIYVVDCNEMGDESSKAWSPPSNLRVSVATCNTRQVLLGTTEGNLFYFEVDKKRRKIEHKAHVQLGCEVACLDCNVMGADSNDGLAKLAAVGLWAHVGSKPDVRLLKLPSLELLEKETLDGNVMARNVLLVTLTGSNYLLVALGDGHVLVYRLDENAFAGSSSGGKILTERRKLSVGTQPASLSLFHSHKQSYVFAACDRPTAIYASSNGGKILVSNVNLREVRRVCSFHSEAFPECLAIATEGTLQLGAVDEIQKLHIHPIPLGETARRIAHMPKSQCFAVICEGTRIDEHDDEVEQVSLRLVGDTTYEVIDGFKLDPSEAGCSISVSSFHKEPIDDVMTNGDASSRDADEKRGMHDITVTGAGRNQTDTTEYLVVGTAYAYPHEEEPRKGRILVFKVVQGKFVQVCKRVVKGAVYCLTPFRHKMLAGINSVLHLFSLGRRKQGSYELHEDLCQSGRIMINSVHVRGDFILIGDLLRCIYLLKYNVDSNGEAFVELARDYHTVWTTATEIMDDDDFVVAENWMNLMTYRRDSYSTVESERSQLKRVGQFHLGGIVNRMRRGTLATTLPESDGPVLQTIVFATVDGKIGVIASLREKAFEFLQKIEKAMQSIFAGVANIEHDTWRQMRIEKPNATAAAAGFIDGDLVEQFMDLKQVQMQKVAEHVGASVDEIVRQVEEMQRLH